MATIRKPKVRPASSLPKKIGIYKVLLEGKYEGHLYWRGEKLGWSMFPFPLTVEMKEGDFWYPDLFTEYNPTTDKSLTTDPKDDPNDPFNQEALM